MKRPRVLVTQRRGLLTQEEQWGFPEEVVFKLSLAGPVGFGQMKRWVWQRKAHQQEENGNPRGP